MMITVVGKYIIDKPSYLKSRVMCSMHKKLNLQKPSTFVNLLPPQILTKYVSLNFWCSDDITLKLAMDLKELYLIIVTSKYISNEKLEITQNDITELYNNIKNETLSRAHIYKYIEHDMYVRDQLIKEIHNTFLDNIIKAKNSFKLCCNGCSCVNKLMFDDAILRKCFSLDMRYDLAYEVLSNIKFQDCDDVANTIAEELDKLRTKLIDTSNKIITMILGMNDINSLTAMLCRDIIMLLIHHFIYDIRDIWIIIEASKHAMSKTNLLVFREV